MRPLHHGMSDPNDIKIFILYLLDAINYPLDYETVHDVCIQNGYVEAFDFAQAFSKLEELGHVLKDTYGSETVYVISDTGRMVANELQSELMLSIREKSLKSAMRLLSFKKRRAKLKASVTERADGKYTLHCEISDPLGSILSVDLCAPSRLQAEEIKRRFEKEPETTYRRLLSVLSGDADYALS